MNETKLYIPISFFWIPICLFLNPHNLSGQEINKRGLSSSDSSRTGGYEQSFSTTLGTLIREKGGRNEYHPLTIKELKNLRENVEPFWSKEEADPERVDRATQKAFAIQGAHHFSYLIKTSDLRFVYRDIQDSMRSIKDFFKYSVQTDGDSMSLSREEKGEKILELDLEFNLKQGVDPQIRIGQHMRFRYDYTYDGTFLEYAVDF